MYFRQAQSRLEVLQIYRLLQFIHQKDTEQIKKMVKFGVENLVNLTEPNDGVGVLHLAVSGNDYETVQLFLTLGAVPDIQNKMGQTPTMLAAELGNDEIVALLAQYHATMTVRDIRGKGVLFYCTYPTKRHTRCLHIALEHDADVNNVSRNGTHIFQLMCSRAKELNQMCLMVLEAGANPNATNTKTGVTALMEAAQAGSLDLVRNLLRKGADVNATDQKQLRAVHYAATGGFFEVIQVLSAFGATMDVHDSEGCTPLHYAAASGNPICCKFIGQRGANAKMKNLQGLRAAQIAKEKGFSAAAKESRKAERIKRKTVGGKHTSEIWALNLHDWSNEFDKELRHGCMPNSDFIKTDAFISELEELNAPIDQTQLGIILALHEDKKEKKINIADFIKGSKYIIKAFLLSAYLPKKKKEKKGRGKKGGKRKGKLDIPVPILSMPIQKMTRRTDGGPPPFMIEKYHHRAGMYRLNPNNAPTHPLADDTRWYRNKPDKVYVCINDCVRAGDFDSLELAFSQGVPVDVQDPFYKTPLMTACSCGNYKMAQHFIQLGADVNKTDQLLWTPLHHAVHKGEIQIVELLIEAEAIIDAKTLDGSTPLMFAIQRTVASCVDVLIKAGANVYATNKRELNCMDIALNVADINVITLVKDKMDSLPKPKDAPRGSSKKPKPKKKK